MKMALDNFTGLELWRQTVSEIVRQTENDADLSSRQMAILLNVYLTDPPHTVRALAADLNISKPAVTRAIDKLSVLGFIKRQTDEKDRRSVNLYRTIDGACFVMRLGDIIAEKAGKLLIPVSLREEDGVTPENKA